MSKSFVPSKTAKNGLNFVKSDDENILFTKDQPEEIVEFFKLIYIIMKEPFEGIENNNIIRNIKESIFSKYNVDSISKLN